MWKMNTQILEDAKASGAIVISFGLQNDEATQYTFVKWQLTKFAELIKARTIAELDAKQAVGSIVGYIDNEQIILKCLSAEKLEVGTKLYAQLPTNSNDATNKLLKSIKEAMSINNLKVTDWKYMIEAIDTVMKEEK